MARTVGRADRQGRTATRSGPACSDHARKTGQRSTPVAGRNSGRNAGASARSSDLGCDENRRGPKSRVVHDSPGGPPTCWRCAQRDRETSTRSGQSRSARTPHKSHQQMRAGRPNFAGSVVAGDDAIRHRAATRRVLDQRCADSLRFARCGAEMTREKLATSAGVSVASISSWERGYRRPSADALSRVARILGHRIGPADLALLRASVEQ